MAGRTVNPDEKIEKAQAEVAVTKAKYDEAVNKPEKLLARKKEQTDRKLPEAFAKSDKSLEEVIRFIQTGSPLHEEDNA